MKQDLAVAREPAVARASVWNTVRTVAWSFFGVRRGGDHARQSASIHPLHLLLAALVGVLVLVGGLMLLVHWVVAT